MPAPMKPMIAALFDAIPEERRKVARGIEVGQIFYFGTKYSEAMGATVVTADGSKVPVEMGSHGIGVSRLLGAIIEASHDDKGIIWPEGVTPFPVGIVNLKQGDAAADAACEGLYKALAAKGLEALYDDRDERAGAKFATMDLIGLPWRITVGPRGLANGVVELTSRRTGDAKKCRPRRRWRGSWRSTRASDGRRCRRGSAWIAAIRAGRRSYPCCVGLIRPSRENKGMMKKLWPKAWAPSGSSSVAAAAR